MNQCGLKQYDGPCSDLDLKSLDKAHSYNFKSLNAIEILTIIIKVQLFY